MRAVIPVSDFVPTRVPRHLFVLYATGVLAAAAVGVASAGSSRPAALAAGVALAVACVAVALSLRPELLFIAWLALGPFFQESSVIDFLGKNVNLVVYRFVPLVLVVTFAVRRSRHRLSVVDSLPLLYLVYVVSSAAFSPSFAPMKAEVRLIYLTIAIGVVVYYFVVLTGADAFFEERLVRALLSSALVVSAMTLVEAASGWNLWHDVVWHRADPPRAVATFANPAVLGSFLAVAIAFALAILVWDGPVSLRRLSLVLMPAALPALFFTYTRGPMIALAATAVLMVFLRTKTLIPALVLLIAVAVVFALSWSRISSSSVYQSRFGVTDTAETRLALQRLSLKLAGERPILGWGFGSFDRVKERADISLADTNVEAALGAQANTSHDTFLTVLVELGITGLAIFVLPPLVIGWRGVKAATRISPDRWILVGSLAALGVYVISASTFDMRFFSYVPMLSWLALGLTRRVTVRVEDEAALAA